MTKKSPFQTAKDVMSGKITAARVAAAEQQVNAKPKTKSNKPTLSPLKPSAKHAAARQAKIRAAREADEKAISAKRKAEIKRGEGVEMDRNMKEGMTNYEARKKNPKKYAKGGKVRGCGIAKRGMGRASSRGR